MANELILIIEDNEKNLKLVRDLNVRYLRAKVTVITGDGRTWEREALRW